MLKQDMPNLFFKSFCILKKADMITFAVKCIACWDIFHILRDNRDKPYVITKKL